MNPEDEELMALREKLSGGVRPRNYPDPDGILGPSTKEALRDDFMRELEATKREVEKANRDDRAQGIADFRSKLIADPSQLLYTPKSRPLGNYPATPNLQPAVDVIAKAAEALRRFGEVAKKAPPGEPQWSDMVIPGSALIKNNNVIKKEGGMTLRKSVTSDMVLGRPRASKTICRMHGEKFVLNRINFSWGCRECDASRVPFSRWYKDTYSLGYFNTLTFKEGEAHVMKQEVVISADEDFKPIALMIQRETATGVNSPVYITDLGGIAVDLVLRALPNEEGYRTITLPALYGVDEMFNAHANNDVDTEDDEDGDPPFGLLA